MKDLLQLLEDVPLAMQQIVVYAWWSSCSFYLWHKAIFVLSLLRSMDKTKWTGLVASAIAQSHIYWLLAVGSSEQHSLLEKCQHTAHALAFDTSGCYNKKMHEDGCLLGCSTV
jgi:hypothetical protein